MRNIKLLEELKKHYAEDIGCKVEEMSYVDVYLSLLSEPTVYKIRTDRRKTYETYGYVINVAGKFVGFSAIVYLCDGSTQGELEYSLIEDLINTIQEYRIKRKEPDGGLEYSLIPYGELTQEKIGNVTYIRRQAYKPKKVNLTKRAR